MLRDVFQRHRAFTRDPDHRLEAFKKSRSQVKALQAKKILRSSLDASTGAEPEAIDAAAKGHPDTAKGHPALLLQHRHVKKKVAAADLQAVTTIQKQRQAAVTNDPVAAPHTFVDRTEIGEMEATTEQPQKPTVLKRPWRKTETQLHAISKLRTVPQDVTFSVTNQETGTHQSRQPTVEAAPDSSFLESVHDKTTADDKKPCVGTTTDEADTGGSAEADMLLDQQQTRETVSEDKGNSVRKTRETVSESLEDIQKREMAEIIDKLHKHACRMIRAAVAPFVKDAATIAIMTWRDNMWNEKEAPPSFPEVSATLLPGSHDSPTNYEFETAEAEGNKKGLMPTEAKPKNNNTAESPAAMVETTTLWEEPGGGKTSQKVPNENSNVASEETPVVTEEAHITSQMMRTDLRETVSERQGKQCQKALRTFRRGKWRRSSTSCTSTPAA